MKNMAKMGKIAIIKWVFRGKQWVIGGKKMGWQPKQKGKMVQNAGSFLKKQTKHKK